MLDTVAMSSGRDLTLMREQCVNGRAPKAKSGFERKWGKGSFPTVADYCVAAITRSIALKQMLDLYINLALQEQGSGEFTFAEDAARVGDGPGRIMKSILAAAEAGQASYAGADGKSRSLSGPQAFDIGATFGALRPDRVTDAVPDSALAARVTEACYDPKARTATVETGGAPQPIQRACVALGKQLGKYFSVRAMRPSDTAPAAPATVTP